MGPVLRGLLVLLLVAAELQGAPARAQRVDQPPALAGTTVVSATTTTRMDVHLADDITVSTKPFGNPLAKILAGGDIAGVVLRQDRSVGAIEILAMHADLCPNDPCRGKPLSVVNVYDPNASQGQEAVTLPADDYQLYLIAHAGRTRVKMRFQGLGGSVALEPTLPAKISFGEPEVALPEATQPYVYETQVPHELLRAGLSFVGFEIDTDHFVAMNLSSCIERAKDAGPTDAFACDGERTAGTTTMTRRDLQGDRTMVMSMGLLAADEWNHRVRYRSAAVIDGFVAKQFLLTYEADRPAREWLYSLTFSW